ncbi:unknown protein 1-like [Bidens hawaiensis]|uniref:unknown protein 1-like n=1 Tax=Bidens hawaiensis TaxID=980011 RepID=UPI00404AB7E8
MDAVEFGNASVKKSDKNSTLMESKNSNIGASMHPITPCLAEAKVKFTPNDSPSSSTPMEDVFDVCAPGPIQKKQSGKSALRKLDYGLNDSVFENKLNNDSSTGTVYESVLDAIIRKEAEDILADILASETDSSHDVLRTPPARVTGPAVCPGAPLKPKRVEHKRIVDMNLCRKLDFGS